MEIDLKIPAQRQQSKEPQKMSTEPPAILFPFGDCEVGWNQIRSQLFSPGFFCRYTFRRKHLGKISCFNHSHPTRPNLIVTIATRLHQQEDCYQKRIYGNNKM